LSGDIFRSPLRFFVRLIRAMGSRLSRSKRGYARTSRFDVAIRGSSSSNVRFKITLCVRPNGNPPDPRISNAVARSMLPHHYACARTSSIGMHVRTVLCLSGMFARRNAESTWWDAAKADRPADCQTVFARRGPSHQARLRGRNSKEAAAVTSSPFLISRGHCVLLIARIIITKERSARLIRRENINDRASL